MESDTQELREAEHDAHSSADAHSTNGLHLPHKRILNKCKEHKCTSCREVGAGFIQNDDRRMLVDVLAGGRRHLHEGKSGM